MRTPRVCLLLTLTVLLSHHVVAQSRYVPDGSSALGVLGGYAAGGDLSARTGQIGVSILGRLDVGLSYGKGTTTERDAPGSQVEHYAMTSLAPSVTYYIVKATPEQPVSFGLMASNVWVTAVQEERTYRTEEKAHTFMFGGDVAAIFELSPAASLVPGFSFVYAVSQRDGGMSPHVMSPAVGLSLGLRIAAPPSTYFLLEPGVIYRTQSDQGITPSISAGLVVIPFRPRG